MHHVIQMSQRLWSVLAALSLVGVPVLFLLAQVLLLDVHRANGGLAAIAQHDAVWQWSHLLLSAWVGLHIPAAVALVQLCWRRVPGYALLGGFALVVGVVAAAMVVGIDFVLAEMAQVPDREAMRSLGLRLSANLIPLLDRLDFALTLGFVVLACGMYRARALPQGAVGLLLVGLAIPGTASLSFISPAVQLLGFAWAAVALLRYNLLVQETRYHYQHARVVAALLTGLFVVGMIFSLERLLLGCVVVLVLGVAEIIDARLPLMNEQSHVEQT